MAEDNSFEVLCNLENLLSPFSYAPEISLPKSNPDVEGGIYLTGFISQDCTWGCCFNKSVIKCFPVDKYFEDNHGGPGGLSYNNTVAVSSASYRFNGSRITCATELAIHNQRTSSGARKLLLGLSHTNSDGTHRELKGAVVIFDPIRCIPIKWIEIPEPVSSVTVLSHFEEGGSNRPFFNETMMAMVGIAAVGLRGGSVIIVDLGLDDPNLTASCTLDFKLISNSSPCYRLVNVNPHEYVIATKRHKAVSKRNLISMRFANEPEDVIVSDAFHYCRPNGESILMLHKNSVGVTCIEYIPVIGSLLVGFTFGGFQIWRVNSMELQFSSESVHQEQNNSVFGFSFQQPVDDPKNYCYIWVMYGSTSHECTTAHIELHSLYYDRKTYVENFGYIYDGFKQCARRLYLPLVDDFLPTGCDGEDDPLRLNARPLRIWTQPDSDLMFCSWEVGRGGVYYIGAFDLNQWYSNHTKETIGYHPNTGLCPFWVALPIDVPDITNLMLDVRITPKSLMRWENPHSKVDIHLYPSSVSFRAVCLTNTGVSAFEHFGIQEKLIRIVLKDGPSLMIQPANLKRSLQRYGVEPVLPTAFNESLHENDIDRYYIFSVLLESRRTAAITRLASCWLDGSFANVGCTIDLIIDWICSYMLAIRSVADEHWKNLLCVADDILPPETSHFINFSNFVWTSLHRVLLTLMNPTEVFTARGAELEDIQYGLEKLVQYSAALLMMHKAQLLPEKDKSFINGLTDLYATRRSNARMALKSCSYVDDFYKNTHPLMIDHLMDNILPAGELREKWNVEPDEPLYPPQHVGYLVNMFMWPDVDQKAISRVFMYFLFDFNFGSRNLHGTTLESGDVERKVSGDFRAVMQTVTEEYSEVLYLWLLDQGVGQTQGHEILVHLREKDRLHESDGFPWCAATVALTASGFGDDIAELLQKSCPVQLTRLLFGLMTASDSKYNALVELIVSNNFNSDDELLKQFFEISEKRNRLGAFIKTTSKDLSEHVRRALVKFLNGSNSMKRLSQLLMFYVHHEDYLNLKHEFSRIQTIVKQSKFSDTDHKKWTFLERYILHLLNSPKQRTVGNFLRQQSPVSVPYSKSTIRIKAMPAPFSSPEENVGRKYPLKALPQFERIKLSETVSNDPLSPLRRYTGRIKTAVATEDRDAPKPQRKSIARRSSFGLSRSRMSLGNNLNFDRTGLNTTTGNITLDKSRRKSLDISMLLQTPYIDHREVSMAGSLLPDNCNQNEISEIFYESQSQPQVHSIMKEKDSSKPRVSKKVELCVDRSMSSEDDDQNNTIFEDADETLSHSANESKGFQSIEEELGEEKMDTTELEEGDNAFNVVQESLLETTQAPSVFNTNFEICEPSSSPESGREKYPSQSEASLFGNAGDDVGDDNELCDDSKSEEVFHPICHKIADNQPDNIKEVTLESPDTKAIVNEDIDESIEVPEMEAAHQPNAPVPILQDAFTEIPVHNTGSPPVTRSTTPIMNIEEVAVVENDKSTLNEFETPNVLDFTIRETRQRSYTPSNHSRASTPAKSADEKDDADKEPLKKRSRRSRATIITRTESNESLLHLPTRTTRSTKGSNSSTPTKDALDESSLQSESIGTRRSTRVSRSRTPTRDIIGEMTDDSVSRSLRRSHRTSHSRTPSRDVVEDNPDEDSEQVIRKSTRISRSRTPTREVVEQSFQESEALPVRRSSRVSRSRTPTREAAESVGSNQEVENTLSRQRTRALRSSTPTREMANETLIESEILSSRKSRVSRSRTPTREANEEIENTLSRQSTRVLRSSTPTRDMADETLIESEILSSRKSRVSRSRTPTRDVPEGNVQEGSNIKRSSRKRNISSRSKEEAEEDIEEVTIHEKPGKRTVRSVFPSTQVLEESTQETETKSLKRDRRSRSKTPTRDVAVEPEVKPVRRSARTTQQSKKLELYDDDSFEDSESNTSHQSSNSAAPVKASTSSSSFALFEESNVIEEEDDVKSEPVVVKAKGQKKKPVRQPKRRLKYFQHTVNLSTLVEDSDSVSDASVLNATVMPPKVEAPAPVGRIKGIKPRTVEQDIEPTKPTKRRKAAASTDVSSIIDFDAQSDVSSVSNISTSSKKSTASSKGRATRRRGRN